MKKITVILNEHVPGLGDKASVHHVTAGYAKNFLFPRRLADRATPDALAHTASEQRRIADAERKKAEETADIVRHLATMSITLSVPVNEQGVLFGGVHEKDIHTQLIKQGIDLIPETAIRIPEKIVRVGESIAHIILKGEAFPIRLHIVPSSSTRST
jgi:large subunit ribosomal protein L9